MGGLKSNDQPWHDDLGPYQINHERKGSEHNRNSLCTNALAQDGPRFGARSVTGAPSFA
jgi:hypothetical protein